jgi:hypothetical protein
MRGEPVELACPFCDKGKIQCWYIPGAISVRNKSTSTFGKVKQKSKSNDIWLIKSGCNVCNKTSEEVEKELKSKGII